MMEPPWRQNLPVRQRNVSANRLLVSCRNCSEENEALIRQAEHFSQARQGLRNSAAAENHHRLVRQLISRQNPQSASSTLLKDQA
jgi:hypothetical protein